MKRRDFVALVNTETKGVIVRIITTITLAVMLLTSPVAGSDISSDERVVFFPTAARLSAAGDAWIVPIHGWIYEPERDSIWRNALIEEVREELLTDATAAERNRFEARGHRFLADNERGERIEVRIADRTFTLPASEENGHFTSEVRLPVDAVKEEKTVQFAAITDEDDARTFVGRARLLEPRGVSVVSDIDDTIKISHVRDRAALLRATLLKAYKAVPGMAEVYQDWAEQGAAFHYISTAPWQLYVPYAHWMNEAGYPPGAFHLTLFRVKDESFNNLMADAQKLKLPRLKKLFKQYPQRTFILIGDDTQADAAAYGEIARAHPDRVAHIFIRRTTEHADGRFEEAFRDLPADKWTVFDEAKALKGVKLPELDRKREEPADSP